MQLRRGKATERKNSVCLSTVSHSGSLEITAATIYKIEADAKTEERNVEFKIKTGLISPSVADASNVNNILNREQYLSVRATNRVLHQSPDRKHKTSRESFVKENIAACSVRRLWQCTLTIERCCQSERRARHIDIDSETTIKFCRAREKQRTRREPAFGIG